MCSVTDLVSEYGVGSTPADDGQGATDPEAWIRSLESAHDRELQRRQVSPEVQRQRARLYDALRLRIGELRELRPKLDVLIRSLES